MKKITIALIFGALAVLVSVSVLVVVNRRAKTCDFCLKPTGTPVKDGIFGAPSATSTDATPLTVSTNPGR